MTEFSVRGMRVAVVGAARSGRAAAELLVSRGARVTLSDAGAAIADSESLAARGIGIEAGGHRLETFEQADLVVLSPGVPSNQPAIAAAQRRGIPVVGEMELASRWLRGRIVAITGTKGKSTTTVLTGRMLEAGGFEVTVGGNIGTPLSSQVEGSTPASLHVVEASSFQLEQIETFHPWIAVALNFSPDHLDRHETLDAYRAAKARIFENQRPSDWAVINADDPEVLAMAREAKATRWRFSRRQVLDDAAGAGGATGIDGSWIVARRGGTSTRLVPLDAIHLLGPHLVDDVMAAATVAAVVGVAPAAMTSAVDSFRGLEHAMELVADRDGVRFVNDSKATNVEAAIRSIESFESGVVAIMGGRFKGGDLRMLRGPLSERARAVVTIGEAAPRFEEALAGAIEVRRAGSLDEAVAEAAALAMPSGVVLLAPACASFDMFKDYAERGQVFKNAVARLTDKA